MSRSFKKKPFQSICGGSSAKQDKIHAHRGERRAVKSAIKSAEDFEDFLIPHIYECSCNDVWGWSRDGNQMYHGLTRKDYGEHIQAISDPDSVWYGDPRFAVWPPAWYIELLRK